MFERVHSYVKRTLFPFVRIGKFREDKPCAILVELYKAMANILKLSIDNRLTQIIVPNMRMQMCYFDM